ncbi:cell surface protein [Halorubrum sp. JWXQ-INN 858]|uniref:YncE family protein n=1 Tax=Halorubrum sp. JWXQ-INN 858 TaxID=2690782 RepID=UPI001359D97C|nr:cell surface protein [Halorubrum sp. JWXQ-INN 858]MWV64529.1 cell surface protein [Halorubrum sp. JWXQ-INN 858]
MNDTTRRRFLVGTTAAGVAALAGCADDEDPDETPADAPEDDPDEPTEAADDAPADDEPAESEPTYEIWGADQGTNTIYIHRPTDDGGFEQVDEIDTGAVGGEVPHMVDYTSDYEYAAVACTVGGRTLIYRTEDRELVANLETGAGSHFAGFSPDDEYVHVDVIGEEKIVRIDADLENETFEQVAEIDVREDETIVDAGIETGSPICHQYAQDGRSLHTLGPSYHDAALVIVDHDDFSVDRAYPGEEVPTNCGTVSHPTDEKFYLTAGLPSDPDADPEEEPEAAAGVGDFYVYDTADDEVATVGSTGGVDAHGFWFTPDGEELWVLNRETNDGVILDPGTDEVVDEIDAFGPEQHDDPTESDAPDIMWASPDGEYMFVTLRGPNPLSGDPHAATGINPGYAVFDVESRERVDLVQPDGDNPDSDFHGIGVRPLTDHDGFTSPPY